MLGLPAGQPGALRLESLLLLRKATPEPVLHVCLKFLPASWKVSWSHLKGGFKNKPVAQKSRKASRKAETCARCLPCSRRGPPLPRTRPWFSLSKPPSRTERRPRNGGRERTCPRSRAAKPGLEPLPFTSAACGPYPPGLHFHPVHPQSPHPGPTPLRAAGDAEAATTGRAAEERDQTKPIPT